MPSSPGLEDFATRQVDSILQLRDGQVKLFWGNSWKIQITEELKEIKLLLIFIFNHLINCTSDFFSGWWARLLG